MIPFLSKMDPQTTVTAMAAAILKRLDQLGNDMHDGAVQAQMTLSDLSRAAQAAEIAAWMFAALCVYTLGRQLGQDIRNGVLLGGPSDE